MNNDFRSLKKLKYLFIGIAVVIALLGLFMFFPKMFHACGFLPSFLLPISICGAVSKNFLKLKGDFCIMLSKFFIGYLNLLSV
jgi:hypothetical protein